MYTKNQVYQALITLQPGMALDFGATECINDHYVHVRISCQTSSFHVGVLVYAHESSLAFDEPDTSKEFRVDTTDWDCEMQVVNWLWKNGIVDSDLYPLLY